MKICFAICEYNPFHNGHMRHINYIKETIKPDALAIIMSGNFTQRGEVAILDKYTRAIHAIKAGADIVFELPTVFATAPAEIFAKGSIKLINCFSTDKVLCFGTESAKKDKLMSTASALLIETQEFKDLYKNELKTGIPSIKARINVLSKMNLENIDFNLLKEPNNILGVEYAKAVLSSDSDIDICPIMRNGTNYNDRILSNKCPSALAIREAIKDKKKKHVKEYIPEFVYNDLPDTLPNADDLIFYSLLQATKNDLTRIQDCSEGLENRIKALIKNCGSVDELKNKLKTKRYTYTRLSRIILSCLLNISKDDIQNALSSNLYLKVLAVNKKNTGLLSELSKHTTYPLITRKSDILKIDGSNLSCFKKDIFANDIYNYINRKHTNEYDMKIM